MAQSSTVSKRGDDYTITYPQAPKMGLWSQMLPPHKLCIVWDVT